MNADEGHEGTLQHWCRVLATLIPKIANPSIASKHWRPICLTSVLQKAYLACIVAVCDPMCEPLLECQYGFREGCQTADIAEAVRLALQKKTAFGGSIFVFKGDVSRAFDNIDHDELCAALDEAGAPPQYAHAVMSEWSHVCLDLQFQGHVWEGLEYSRGGKQGGTETPTMWCRLLDGVIRRARSRWNALSLGLVFEAEGFLDAETAARMDIAVWADDIILASNTKAGLELMFDILTSEMRKVGLDWKPGSLEALKGGDAWEPGCVIWSGHSVQVVQRMLLLGVCVDIAGSDSAAIDHREAQAWVHFHERKAILCDRRIPLRLRWRRLQQTVLRTFLHGAGAWAQTVELPDRINALERKMLKLTLKQSTRPTETPADFHKRLNAKVSVLIDVFRYETLASIVKMQNVGWLGHVARRPDATYSRILRWRGASWQVARRAAGQPLGYVRAGRPRASVEDAVVQSLGPMYAELAGDRLQWRHARWLLCPGAGLAHYSNRTRDSLPCGQRLRLPVSFVHFADSMQVARQSMGLWQAAGEFKPYAKAIQWQNHILRDILGVAPWRTDSRYLHFNEHCGRASNGTADALANYVLDQNRDIYIVQSIEAPALQELLSAGANLALFSDGASRGNPGPAAVASILCLVESNSCDRSACQSLFLNSPHSVQCKIVACMGRRIGTATSSVAEFEAACMGRRLLIEWLNVNSLIM